MQTREIVDLLEEEENIPASEGNRVEDDVEQEGAARGDPKAGRGASRERSLQDLQQTGK